MENPFFYSYKQDLNTISVWDSLHGLEPTNCWYSRFYVNITGLGIMCDWGIQSLLVLYYCQTKTSAIVCSTILKTLVFDSSTPSTATWQGMENSDISPQIQQKQWIKRVQWEKKPIIWSKGVLMAIRYTEIPLTPSLLLFKRLKLLTLYSFFCFLHLTPSIFSTFFPAIFFLFQANCVSRPHHALYNL